TLTVTSSDDQLFNTTSVNLSANGSFAYQLQLFGWSATKYGDWKVIAKYGIHKGATSFEVREPNSIITAKVNKQSFQVGETITVSGRTAVLGSDVSVHFYIAGSRILYKFAPTPVSDDYTYSYELVPDKGLVPGSYEVLVTHNGKEASTSFIVKAPVTGDNEPRQDPLGLFALKPKSSNGTVLTNISTGQQIVLSTTLANENDEDIFFTGLIEIRNSQGVTQYLGSQNGMVVKKGFTAFGMAWMPDMPGTYQARIFLLTSLSNPEILSPVVTSELVISARQA
ncbi:MAG: hypothetical protein MN733_35960, partial [Nitrososphaera sp.]|nr:hypothetical protein [Nitrososphaera sp.]